MKNHDLNMLLYRIANYYYTENLSQNEIAKLENVSRSQISRLLIMARERGFVEIKLSMPNIGTEAIQEQLQTRLGVRKVMIAQSKSTETIISSDDDSIIDLATYAAAVVPTLICDSNIIGLGWGRTIYNVAVQLPIARENSKKLFLSLVGNSGTRNPYLQTSSIVNRFSERFASSAFYANSAFIYYCDLLPKTIPDEPIEQLKQYWSQLDAAIIGVGPKPEGQSFYISEIEATGISRDSVLYQSATGEMLGHLFNENGQINWGDLTSAAFQFIGIPLDTLKSIPNVICIAAGATKIAAIIDAAHNQFFSTLITDFSTAKLLLDELEIPSNNDTGIDA